jgi:sRNA-binding protein
VDLFQSESIDQLSAAIVKAQLALVPAAKDHVNPFFKSKYADLPTVWEASGPFRENGIAITQSPMDAPDEYIVLDTQLSHISGQWMRSRLKIRVAKNDPQGYGSALTYARRYALGCMTGIVTEEDDDGNAASMPQKERTYQAAQQHKQTAQAKIAELRDEGPARQDGGEHPAGLRPASGDAASQQGPDAAAPFTWRMGKHKGKPITEIELAYLAWACTNMTAEDHRLAATEEIDRRQQQDVMAFESEQVETQ